MRALIGSPLILLAACGASAGTDRVALSGQQVDRTFPAAGFDRISLEGPYAVTVRVGPAHGVAAKGDSALIDAMVVTIEDGELRIGRVGRSSYSSTGDADVVVTVTAPALTAASVGGSGSMSVDRVTGDAFAAAVGGSGSLRVGVVEAGEVEAALGGSGAMALDRVRARSVDISLGGSGAFRAVGASDATAVSVAGSGQVDAPGLVASTASVSMAGSGDVVIGARRSADVSMMGSGRVRVRGTSNCTISKMGSGTVRCDPAA